MNIELEPLLQGASLVRFHPKLLADNRPKAPIKLLLGDGSYLQFSTFRFSKEKETIKLRGDQVMLDLGYGQWTGFLSLNLTFSADAVPPTIPSFWYNLQLNNVRHHENGSIAFAHSNPGKHRRFLTSTVLPLPEEQFQILAELAEESAKRRDERNKDKSAWSKFGHRLANFWL